MLLNCHTCYSFRYGTLSVQELLNQIQQKGYTQFVLSDINNTSACLETIKLANEAGIKAIVGIDFRNGIKQQYVGIARNNLGFRELNEHLSHHIHHEKNFNLIAPEFSNAYIIYPFHNYTGWKLKENEFVGVSAKDISTFRFLSFKEKNKLVVLQPTTFANKQQYNAHRLLRAIDKNTLLSLLPTTDQTTQEEIFIEKHILYQLYHPYASIIANTENILNDCIISFEYGKFSNKNLKHYTENTANDLNFLRSEAEKGLAYRFNTPSQKVLQRIEKELEIIGKMNFASYFLMNNDIIKYAQHKNYFYIGRGSGANSLIAYLLRITDVDPIELDLYFERFINPFRSTPPDFDIDFSWKDRNDITRYIFDRFGNTKTALLGAYNTFQYDATIRELGKVFGLPITEIDKLQRKQEYSNTDELEKLILRYGNFIQGLPNHLSVHSSGIIISEEPITCYTATNMPPKGYSTTQFSMLEAEDIGLYKFDILSQRGLGKIKDAIEIIKENKGIEIDIHDLSKFKKDEKIKDLLRQGKTIGCFYVESPAMRMLLTKLKADDYLRLVAASSIIRPGVAKSGMMREYILRFRNIHLRKKAREQLPELYDLLEETYGVMVYQEDVIKVAHFFAGLTLAEADYLRRGMSWKFKQRSEFSEVQQKFISNCREKGHSEKIIFDTWAQIESFANFAFSKGHSASYAVESYQALFLKAHFPLEYVVAILNNGGGFYRKDLYIHEAKMNGAEIKLPCVNNGEVLCSIKENTIYLGLSMITELEEQTINNILNARKLQGNFLSLQNFTNRVQISIEQIRILIRANALRFTKKNKKELLWEIHSLINPIKKEKSVLKLFETDGKSWKLPALNNCKVDETFDEIELFGFSLSSPFNLLREEIQSKLVSSDLINNVGKTVNIVGSLVNIKTTYTTKGERMYFGTFLDMEGKWIDTVHFPQATKQSPFNGQGCYSLTGKVAIEYDFLYIEITCMKRIEIIDREI